MLYFRFGYTRLFAGTLPGRITTVACTDVRVISSWAGTARHFVQPVVRQVEVTTLLNGLAGTLRCLVSRPKLFASSIVLKRATGELLLRC
jgi:hypothetical protein